MRTTLDLKAFSIQLSWAFPGNPLEADHRGCGQTPQGVCVCVCVFFECTPLVVGLKGRKGKPLPFWGVRFLQKGTTAHWTVKTRPSRPVGQHAQRQSVPQALVSAETGRPVSCQKKDGTPKKQRVPTHPRQESHARCTHSQYPACCKFSSNGNAIDSDFADAKVKPVVFICMLAMAQSGFAMLTNLKFRPKLKGKSNFHSTGCNSRPSETQLRTTFYVVNFCGYLFWHFGAGFKGKPKGNQTFRGSLKQRLPNYPCCSK